MRTMRKYCRYCSHMVCGDANYCEVREKTYSDNYIKRVNNCKDFDLNPIDALMENPKGYTPRVHKNDKELEKQMEWSEVMK